MTWVLPGPRTSIVRGNCERETSVKRRNKIVQEITRNIANVFRFYAIIDRTWFFNALTFARSLGRCWKQRPSASVFNTSNGTWRMLMHEKLYLIPILVRRSIVWTRRKYVQGYTLKGKICSLTVLVSFESRLFLYRQSFLCLISVSVIYCFTAIFHTRIWDKEPLGGPDIYL